MLITKFTAARITKLVATGVRTSFSHPRVHAHWFSSESVPDTVQGPKLQHAGHRVLLSSVLVRTLKTLTKVVLGGMVF